MMETESKCAERIREWTPSRQSAAECVQGRGFQASTLRWWASRLAPGKFYTLGCDCEAEGRTAGRDAWGPSADAHFVAALVLIGRKARMTDHTVYVPREAPFP